MRHVREYLEGGIVAMDETPRNEVTQEIIRLVERVFLEFWLCPGYAAYFPDDEKLNFFKTRWAAAFAENGITTDAQINTALKRLPGYLAKWPNPPSVGQFIEWTKPRREDFGLPAIDEAFELSLKMNVWMSHFLTDNSVINGVIKTAIGAIGANEYRSMSRKNAFKAFEYAYHKACELHYAGKTEKIEKPIAENPEPHPQDRERNDKSRREAMKNIWGALGVIK